jgi:TctA family transporter
VSAGTTDPDTPGHSYPKGTATMYIFGGIVALLIASVLLLHFRPELAKKWANFKYRPHFWFAIAVLYLLALVQDVHAGRSFIADLITMIIAILLGAYHLRRIRQQKRGADR